MRPIRDGIRFLLIIFKVGTLYSPLKLNTTGHRLYTESPAETQPMLFQRETPLNPDFMLKLAHDGAGP